MIYLIGSPILLVSWYPIGYIVDRYKGFYVLLLASCVRGIPLILTYFLDGKDCWLVTGLLILVMFGNFFENLVCDGYF